MLTYFLIYSHIIIPTLQKEYNMITKTINIIRNILVQQYMCKAAYQIEDILRNLAFIHIRLI